MNADNTNDTLNKTDPSSVSVNIYRYKFDDEFIVRLNHFSKIHQYDDRKQFKDSWNVWVEEEKEIIEKEINRIESLGYKGDIYDKMFKSARYYYRKKSNIKKEPSRRRHYITLDKDVLMSMDDHIKQNISNKNYSPAIGFNEYVKENQGLIKEEVARLIHNDLTDIHELKNKIKKTYKNRYSMFVNEL